MGHKRAATSATGSTKATARRRKPRRARPTPRWLTGRKDLDEVAQRRCLLVLSVLSGERPVTTAVEELGISRPLYYQLETKALVAMLKALAPGADAANPDAATPAARVAALEAKVARLEQEKRRVERLLYLTRKVLPPGPVTAPGARRGRPPGKTRPASTTAGPRPSRSSPTSATTSGAATTTPSIPTKAGGTTP